MLFLGTSSGAPTKARNVSGLALAEETGRQWFMVDCGEASQHRLLHLPLSLAGLQAIFLTHVHGDHCYGLPGLLASAGMQSRTRPLWIIGPEGIEEWVRATQSLTQLFLPFELHFLRTETLGNWRIGNWLVDAFPLSHRVPSFAYRFTEAQTAPRLDLDKLAADHVSRGPAWGQLRNGADVFHEGRLLKSRDYLRHPNLRRRIVVGGDNDRPELLSDACRQAQVLVHEATYTQDIAEGAGSGYGHSSAAATAAFAESAGIPNLVLTHFSARYAARATRSPSIADLREEAARHYTGQLFLAEDFDRYRLDKDGRFVRLAGSADGG